MTIKHHLDDATLMSLSAGTLGEALTAVASAHISMCKKCRSRLRDMDMIGGIMLSNCPPRALEKQPHSAGEFAAMHWENGAKDKVMRTQAHSCDLPAPMSWLVGQDISDIPWKWIGPGVATHVLPLSEGATGNLRLLKVAPNKKLPEHGHGGGELTLVIKGAYRDKFGVFGPSDIADMDEDAEHQPIVEPGEDCICVVACEAPAKFKGPIARMLQPLIGM